MLCDICNISLISKTSFYNDFAYIEWYVRGSSYCHINYSLIQSVDLELQTSPKSVGTSDLISYSCHLL